MSTIDFISVQDAAVQLGLSPRRVQKFCKEGRLGVMIAGRYLIKEAELKRFKKQKRQAGRPKRS